MKLIIIKPQIHVYNIFWGIWLILKCFVPSPDTFILPEYVKQSYIQKVYVVKNNVNHIVFLRLYNFSCFLLSVKILQINNIKQYIGHNKIHQVLIYIYIFFIYYHADTHEKETESNYFLGKSEATLLYVGKHTGYVV